MNVSSLLIVGLLAQPCHSVIKKALIKYLFDNKQPSIFCRLAISHSMACVQPQGGCELLSKKLMTKDNMLNSKREHTK